MLHTCSPPFRMESRRLELICDPPKRNPSDKLTEVAEEAVRILRGSFRRSPSGHPGLAKPPEKFSAACFRHAGTRFTNWKQAAMTAFVDTSPPTPSCQNGSFAIGITSSVVRRLGFGASPDSAGSQIAHGRVAPVTSGCLKKVLSQCRRKGRPRHFQFGAFSNLVERRILYRGRRIGRWSTQPAAGIRRVIVCARLCGPNKIAPKLRVRLSLYV